MTASVSFEIPGRIAGKGRPRASVVAGRPRLRTPDKTVLAEGRVRDAWRAAGSPYLGDAPIGLTLEIHEQRPASHFTSKGDLNAEGRRKPYPARKPDLDNVVKLCCDALNGCLWRDDAQVVSLHVARVWAERDRAVLTAEPLVVAVAT